MAFLLFVMARFLATFEVECSSYVQRFDLVCGFHVKINELINFSNINNFFLLLNYSSSARISMRSKYHFFSFLFTFISKIYSS